MDSSASRIPFIPAGGNPSVPRDTEDQRKVGGKQKSIVSASNVSMHSARIKRAGLSVYVALVISKYRDSTSAINAGRNYARTDRVFIDLRRAFRGRAFIVASVIRRLPIRGTRARRKASWIPRPINSSGNGAIIAATFGAGAHRD
jgi:hypothetical protein